MFEKEALVYATVSLPDGYTKIDYQKKTDWQKGAEFGYNKAKEWHYVKDGKPKDNEYVLIYTDLKNTYVARIPTEKNYFITRRGVFVQMSAVIAWKEIVLPKEIE